MSDDEQKETKKRTHYEFTANDRLCLAISKGLENVPEVPEHLRTDMSFVKSVCALYNFVTKEAVNCAAIKFCKESHKKIDMSEDPDSTFEKLSAAAKDAVKKKPKKEANPDKITKPRRMTKVKALVPEITIDHTMYMTSISDKIALLRDPVKIGGKFVYQWSEQLLSTFEKKSEKKSGKKLEKEVPKLVKKAKKPVKDE